MEIYGHLVPTYWWCKRMCALSQCYTAHNQLSMWRQLQLHTEMTGMHQAAQATAPRQPCQALPLCLLQHVPCGCGKLQCLIWGMITGKQYALNSFPICISMSLNLSESFWLTWVTYIHSVWFICCIFFPDNTLPYPLCLPHKMEHWGVIEMAGQLPKELFSLELQSGIWKTQPSIIRVLAKALLISIETVYVFIVVEKILCLGVDSIRNVT